MALYLCVDCGATKTAAAISNASGIIIGRGSGGPSNITYLTVETFIATIKETVGWALQQVDLSWSSALPPSDPKHRPFTAAWFGISGADSPAAIAKVELPLSKLLGIPVGPHLVIANDTHLLSAPLRLHSEVSQAVAVIAGTGSNAVSFKEVEGKIVQVARVGGWGWILGDEGGGYDVGREALRQILLLQDKASITRMPLPESRLVDSVLQRFGVDNIMELLGVVYLPNPDPSAEQSDPNAIHNLVREKRVSSLSPLIFEAAFEHNDPLALGVLKTTASNLAAQIAILLGDNAPDSDGNTIKAADGVLSLGGSLVKDTRYRKLLLDDLTQRGHVFKYVDFTDDAAAGGAAGLAKTIIPSLS